MNMKLTTGHIAEVALIVWAITKSPILAFFLIMMFIYLNEEKKAEVKRRLDERPKNNLTIDDVKRIEADERKRALTQDNLKDPLVMGSVSNFQMEGNYIIDNYDNRFYRVMTPNGNYLERIFLTLEEAKQEIEIASSVIPEPKPRGRKIYDVRFVR